MTVTQCNYVLPQAVRDEADAFSSGWVGSKQLDPWHGSGWMDHGGPALIQATSLVKSLRRNNLYGDCHTPEENPRIADIKIDFLASRMTQDHGYILFFLFHVLDYGQAWPSSKTLLS